jgi:hypothetical protein
MGNNMMMLFVSNIIFEYALYLSFIVHHSKPKINEAYPFHP